MFSSTKRSPVKKKSSASPHSKRFEDALVIWCGHPYSFVLMLRRYRHRRGPYAIAAPSRQKTLLRKIIWYAIFLLLLYWMGSKVLVWISGAAVQSKPAMLTVEEGSRANVSFDGGLLQPAESGVSVHPGDRIVTAAGFGILDFFDGSRLRMDEQADLTILESEKGEKTSSLALQLDTGAIWIRTPLIESSTGGVMTRSVVTPTWTLTIPDDTEAVLEKDGIIVFNADGEGVAMLLNAGETIIIGEGQQIRFPDPTAISGDPLRFRSAINPLAVQRSFVEDARRLTAPNGSIIGTPEGESDLLTIRTPQENAVVSGNTVLIDGSVDPRIDRVRVNGYLASIDRGNGSFQQELSLREGASTMTIRIEALDARGLSLAETTRTVRTASGSQTVSNTDAKSPSITAPALTGQTYRTQKNEIIIRGTAPAGTQSIEVNDYRLQLFAPGNPTWSYLATTVLNNLQTGRNIFNVYAIDASGKKSTAATITIVLEEGTEGVVENAQNSTVTSPPVVINESDLPTNDPLTPGIISISAPEAGASYTATGTGFLLEGSTSKQTASIWVNGYRLQLYASGKTFWNYIASTALGTLKEGTNSYKIVARDSANQILDTFTYTVEYNP